MARGDAIFDTVAFEQITVSTTSIGLTATQVAKCGQRGRALIAVEANPVRWRADGTAPTAAVGTLQSVGTFMVVDGEADLNSIRFIRQGAADGTLSVHYQSIANG